MYLDLDQGVCVAQCPPGLQASGTGRYDRKCLLPRDLVALQTSNATGWNALNVSEVHRQLLAQYHLVTVSGQEELMSWRLKRELALRDALKEARWTHVLNWTHVPGAHVASSPAYAQVLSFLVALEIGAELTPRHLLVLEDRADLHGAACGVACLAWRLAALEKSSRGNWDVALLGGTVRTHGGADAALTARLQPASLTSPFTAISSVLSSDPSASDVFILGRFRH